MAKNDAQWHSGGLRKQRIENLDYKEKKAFVGSGFYLLQNITVEFTEESVACHASRCAPFFPSFDRQFFSHFRATLRSFLLIQLCRQTQTVGLEEGQGPPFLVAQ